MVAPAVEGIDGPRQRFLLMESRSRARRIGWQFQFSRNTARFSTPLTEPAVPVFPAAGSPSVGHTQSSTDDIPDTASRGCLQYLLPLVAWTFWLVWNGLLDFGKLIWPISAPWFGPPQHLTLCSTANSKFDLAAGVVSAAAAVKGLRPLRGLLRKPLTDTLLRLEGD